MPRKVSFSVEEFSTAIMAVHNAGVDADMWPVTLQRIADFFGSRHAVLSMRTSVNGSTREYRVNECGLAMISDYANHYGRLDVLRQAVVRAREETILTTSMVMPSAELRRSEFYFDFMVRHGIQDGMEVQMQPEAGPGFRAGFAVLRAPCADNFERHDIQRLTLLLPHLRRALRTHMRLDSLGVERDCAVEALDHLSHGMLIVDAEARMIYANAAGEAILRRGNGLELDQGDCLRLRASNARQTAALRRMVAQAAGCNPGTLLPRMGGINGAIQLERAAGDPLLVCAAPMRAGAAWNASSRPRVLLLIGAPQGAVSPSVALLRMVYGLTESEAAAARAVAQGRGVEEAAEALGTARSTVRWHLQRVYQKTGTTRQADLTRLVERVAALAGHV